jgi:hypothetical protein
VQNCDLGEDVTSLRFELTGTPGIGPFLIELGVKSSATETEEIGSIFFSPSHRHPPPQQPHSCISTFKKNKWQYPQSAQPQAITDAASGEYRCSYAS